MTINVRILSLSTPTLNNPGYGLGYITTLLKWTWNSWLFYWPLLHDQYSHIWTSPVFG